MPQFSGLKKNQEADALVMKTIKPAAAPSAVARDRSNEWKKESKRNSENAAARRYIFILTKEKPNQHHRPAEPQDGSNGARVL